MPPAAMGPLGRPKQPTQVSIKAHSLSSHLLIDPDRRNGRHESSIRNPSTSCRRFADGPRQDDQRKDCGRSCRGCAGSCTDARPGDGGWPLTPGHRANARTDTSAFEETGLDLSSLAGSMRRSAQSSTRSFAPLPISIPIPTPCQDRPSAGSRHRYRVMWARWAIIADRCYRVYLSSPPGNLERTPMVNSLVAPTVKPMPQTVFRRHV